MNLYLISQSTNGEYDTYDSAVVAAESEVEARNMHPNGKNVWDDEKWDDAYSYSSYTWTFPENVQVEFLGTTDLPKGVICASFNAG